MPIRNGAQPAGAVRTIGTAHHVCQIFDCFTVERSALSLTQIADEVGLRKSSVYRLLQTLVLDDYLAFDPHSRHYRLGRKVGLLVTAYRSKNSLSAIAQPFLEQIRDATRETSALQVRDGEVRYCIAELPSPEPIKMILGENVSYSAKNGASGHILRAFAADWSRQRDRAALKAVRAARYAVSFGEIIPGALAIYVPVCDASGLAVAALGIHGPGFRISQGAIGGIVSRLSGAADEIAARLGPE
jgi:IclR family transcriptional regulator, acetate operon repressor